MGFIMEPSTLVEQLDWQMISLFKGLPRATLELVIDSAYTRGVQADEFMFFEGDPAKASYVLLSGSIKLTQTTPKGDQVIMRYVSPGEEFGIVAVLSEINFPVTSQAVTASEVIAWSDETLRRLMMEQPKIAINGIHILAARVREFQQRTQELSTERMERRIARALLRLAQQSGKKVPAGVQIDLRLTRQDLAELTGTSMYSVSRTLSQWENLGLINCSREQVTICLPHELVRIAEDLQ